MLTLLFGAMLQISYSASTETFERYGPGTITLFLAMASMILLVFEYGAPDSIRVRQNRVIQCYPELKRVQNSTNKSRTGTPVTARSRAARPANLR